MNSLEARERFAVGRVARLATVDGDGAPHLVPVTFAVLADGERVVTVVDHKPKRTRALKRLANIRANPRVSLLVDLYSDNWSALWWARADGVATIEEPHFNLISPLIAKYDQYGKRTPEGPVIVVTVDRWSGWSAATGR